MKQWKIVCLLSLFLLMGFALHAQNDIVRLKNGSFIRGTIIEYIAGDHVKIQTVEGKIYEFPASEIERADAGSGGVTSVRRIPKEYEIKTEGYYNVTSIGLMFGSAMWGPQVNPGVYTVNGWQWNPHLQTGLGIGMEYFDFGGKMPITADVRFNILKGKVTPFFGGHAGYTVATSKTGRHWDWWGEPLNNRNFGGITSGLVFGFRSYCGPHLAITMHGGYRFQKFRSIYDEQFWNGAEMITHEVESKSYLHRFNLSFGLQFN
jgi:hypothetical protein